MDAKECCPKCGMRQVAVGWFMGPVLSHETNGVECLKRQCSTLTARLAALEDSQRQLETEWDQLQVEQSNLARHSRIDAIARTLNMSAPGAARTQYMTAGGAR